MSKAIVLLVVLLAGCSMFVPDDYDPQFDIPATCATTPAEVCVWVDARVAPVGDEIHGRMDYWQSPIQTITWRTGDCEDFAILVLYLIHRDLGGWPELVYGRVLGNYHGWVRYNGREYESLNGVDVTSNSAYRMIAVVSYGDALWRSMNTHRKMEE